MNWKKRVVSIILMLTTIITILPAEQVFAEASDAIQTVTITGNDWAAHAMTDKTWFYPDGTDGDGQSESGYSIQQAFSLTDYAKSVELITEGAVDIGKEGFFNVQRNATESFIAIPGDASEDICTALNVKGIAETIVKKALELSNPDEVTGVKFDKLWEGATPIYTQHSYWSDSAKVNSKSETNWAILSTSCRYNETYQKFVTVSAFCVRDKSDGEASKFIISGKVGDYPIASGMYNNAKQTVVTDDVVCDTVEQYIYNFLDVTGEAAQNRLLNALKQNIKLDLEDMNTSPDKGVLHFNTELKDGTTAIVPPAEDVKGGLAELIGFYYAASWFAGIDASASALFNCYDLYTGSWSDIFGQENDVKKVRDFYKNVYNPTWNDNMLRDRLTNHFDQDLYLYAMTVNLFTMAGLTELELKDDIEFNVRYRFEEFYLDAGDNPVDAVNASKADASKISSSDWFDKDDSKRSKVAASKITLPSATDTAFGMSTTVNVDKSTSVWDSILAYFRNYASTMYVASKFTYQVGSTDKCFGCYRQVESYTNLLDLGSILDRHNALAMSGLYEYMALYFRGVDEINFKSDTGTLLIDKLQTFIENGSLTVSYTGGTQSDLIDWKTYDSPELVVGNPEDLLFVLSMAYQASITSVGDNPFPSINVVSNIDGKEFTFNLYTRHEDIGTYSGWYKQDQADDTETLYIGHLNSFVEAFAEVSSERGDMRRAGVKANYVWKLAGKPDNVFLCKFGDYRTLITAIDYQELMNEDVIRQLEEQISRLSGELTYTGTVMNCLPYMFDEFIYSEAKIVYGVGEDSLLGIAAFSPFDNFSSIPFRRGVLLEGTSYADDYGADYDYLPRMPRLSTYKFSESTEKLFYNIDYGLNVMNWSTWADENSSDYVSVEMWLKNNATTQLQDIFTVLSQDGVTAIEIAESGIYEDVPEAYMSIFKTIIGVHKLCDYMSEAIPSLGMTGHDIARNWSPAVLGFYELYEKEYSGMDGKNFFEVMEGRLTNYIMAEYTYSDAIEPLGFVARFKDEQFSSQWKYGYAITSHYVPFQTNLYEISAIEELITDTEWVTEFYYKYGFYRKALYVTTDSEAVVDRILTGTQSGTKVATLRDLLNYERDIELYIDQSFYNADELEKQLDKFISNAGSNSVFGSIFDAISLTPSIILKTGGYSSYSKEVATNVKPIIGNADMVEEKEYAYDSFLLSEDDVLGKDGFLSAYEYSIQQPYGVVSAIYRTHEIYNAVGKASVKNQPVFVSSKNAVGIQANNYGNYRMFYNYITLSSLQSIIDHETTLLVDLDAPIFMDIFGNIVTADGYVIIPAAANATLAGDAFTPYSIGYATFVHNADELVYGKLTPQFYDWFYGTDYAYLTGNASISSKTSTYRELCQNTGGGYMFLKSDGTTSMGTTTVTDGVASATVVWDNLNTRLAVLKNLLMSVHFINSANFWDDTHINMVIEVLRGAPMEHIDLDKEGLVVDSGMGPFEAYIAYRVEQLQQSIKTDSNGTEKDKGLSFTFSVLDIFHIESAERIALLAVKCLLIGFLLLLAAMIVADASVGKMPLNVVYRIVVTCILTGACISLIPVLADFSLSTTTRSLLQKEASEMLAMRAQKEAQGIEIGVVQTFPVESTTDIVVKVGELDVQWYDLLLFSAYSSVDNSFEDLYREAEHGIPIANAPYTVRRGKELYIDIGQIMDTTVVQYDATEGVLTNHVAGYVDDAELSASYMLPYYVILDQLVANVNMYNAKNGVTPKNYSVNSDGSIRTQDLTYAYFHSNEFLTDTYDILDMGRWFNVHTPKIMYAPFFTEDDIKSFNLSVWYPTEADQTQLLNSMDKLYNKAREYVLENSEMLSYVSDAAYLKSLAMYLAVEYNSIFGVGIADAFEVKCLDTEDLLRYVIGTPDQVYKFANRTYARYAHEVNGGLGSLLAGALYIVFCLCNIVKVASFLLVYITCIGSIVYHRIFKREDQYALYGFFILIGELTIVNLVYAALFKVCMNLTRWGVPGILACLLVILFCVGMIFAFLSVGNNGVKNIKNLGRAEVEAINHFFSGVADRMHNHRTAAAPSDAVERTVGVLQAHDFTRQEYDDFEGNRGSVDDLKAHDRRRREGKVKDDSTD